VNTHDYDVAFSFAGEQRPYVEKVYDILNTRGVRVFYDGGQIASLWGKDLYQYLTEVYSTRARYCVIFLSQDYAQKLWTRHELKAAQARAFKESEEYLLPARFDETSIPGLLPTVAYVDLRQLSPEDFADLVMEKLRGTPGSTSTRRQEVEPMLEASLADAVLYAEEYLQPQTLDLSDAIAEAVRRSFERAAVKIERASLVPYLRSESAAHRVTGYIAYQVSPQKNMALDFVTSLRREKDEAANRKETRPLWQLLVCIGKLLRLDINRSEVEVITTSLRDFLEWMKKDPSLDPGGECKRRIRLLLEG
jgi:hypothetical protein